MVHALITNRLQELNWCVDRLGRLQRFSYEQLLDDPEKAWAVEHGLQIAIQIVLDIGNHLLARMGQNQIEDYTDVLDKLGQHGILPASFAADIRGMAGFRNVLVHRYTEVDLEQVYELLQNHLDDFDRYMGYIEDYLASTEAGLP